MLKAAGRNNRSPIHVGPVFQGDLPAAVHEVIVMHNAEANGIDQWQATTPPTQSSRP